MTFSKAKCLMLANIWTIISRYSNCLCTATHRSLNLLVPSTVSDSISINSCSVLVVVKSFSMEVGDLLNRMSDQERTNGRPSRHNFAYIWALETLDIPPIPHTSALAFEPIRFSITASESSKLSFTQK